MGATGSLTLLLSSCIKINSDYDSQWQEAPTSAAQSADETTEQVVITTTQAETPSSVQPPNHTSSTDSEETSSTSTASTPDSTTTSTATEFPVDTNNGEWTPFKVTLASESPTTLPSGYSLQLPVVHDKIVSSGGDAEGKDLAIVYVQDSVGRSLDRWRDPKWAWNSPETRLWFNLQRPIGPGETQTGYYYLVRGSSVFKAKEDPNQIFLAYDDFQDGNFRAQDWRDVNEASGNSEIVATADGIALRVSATGSEVQRRSLVSTWNQAHSGVLAEARYRIPSSANEPCNRLIPMSFETSSDNRAWQGMGLDNRRWRRTAFSSSSSEVQFHGITDTLPDEDDNWHRYAITWHEDKAGIWRDGQLIDWVNRLDQGVVRPSEQPIHLRLATQARSYGCMGTVNSQIEFDWVWLRTYSNPEPKSGF